MRILILCILLFLSFETFAQKQDTILKVNEYYPDGIIKLQGNRIDNLFVDTLFSYNPKGKLVSITVYGEPTLPRIVKTYQDIKGAAAMKVVGTYIQTDVYNMKKDGIWLYYRKNGSVMDSVIFENGKQIYRARLNNGKLLFEEK